MFSELPFTLADGSVWLSIGQGLLFGAVCLLFGIWIARLVGLLDADAPAGESLGVGLTSGLLVVASWWAAIASGGRSSFTPVAIGFVIAIGLAVVRHSRHPAGDEVSASSRPAARELSRTTRHHDLLVAVVGGGVFVIAVALLYGSTLIQSPRDGVQPLEFMDEAYYSILGADLATTGTETIYSPSGFDELPGLPSQTWYHWGEVWLAAAAITIFGSTPLDARHLIILPLLLLAAAAMTGTLVRRMTGTSSRGAYLFGFFACLFLAPVPFARGLVFGITTYGLAAIAVLLALYGLAVLGRRPPTWALAAFAGSAVTSILPAHVVIAVLGMVGIGSVWAVRIGRSILATRHLPAIVPIWRRTFIITAIALVATVGWGLATGHGAVYGTPSPTVTSFNEFWVEVVVLSTLGAGAFLAIAIAWVMGRGRETIETDLYLGTAMLVVTGAVVWGARLGDFDTFHLFLGAIAVFGTPVAAVAVWSIFRRLRRSGYGRLASVVLGICIAQMLLGVPLAIDRLQVFGPGTYPPVPAEVLSEIRSLPADARLAYACRTAEESTFWNPRLLGISAHTGRRIVPMCFASAILDVLTGGELDVDVPSVFFAFAPQRVMYPAMSSDPSPTSVAAFLKANGIHYIYADALHPNTLAPGASSIAEHGDIQILELP